MSSSYNHHERDHADSGAPHYLGASGELFEEWFDGLEPELVEHRRRAVDRDFAFLMRYAESQTDHAYIREAIFLLHFGRAIEVCGAEFGERPRVFGERLEYMHVLSGRYQPSPRFEKALVEQIGRLYARIDFDDRHAGRHAFERDLDFLLQAAETETELVYSLHAMALVHWHLAVEAGTASVGPINADLRGRLDYVLERFGEHRWMPPAAPIPAVPTDLSATANAPGGTGHQSAAGAGKEPARRQRPVRVEADVKAPEKRKPKRAKLRSI